MDDIYSILEAMSLDPVQTPELDLDQPAPEGFDHDE